MALFDEKTKEFLCECGCGTIILPWNTWARGHRPWTDEDRRKASERGSDLVYFPTDEQRENLSVAKKEYWDSKEGLREREKRSKAMSGTLRSDEERENIRRAVQEFWDSKEGEVAKKRQSERRFGSTLSDEAIENISRGRIEFYRSEEGQEWLDKYWRGENSPNWKGRHSHDYGYGWRAVREVIIIRDSYTCQGCGCKGDFSSLEVHHIDGDPDNWDEKNEITVCHSCNIKASVKSERSYWEDFYSSRIEEIYRVGV